MCASGRGSHPCSVTEPEAIGCLGGRQVLKHCAIKVNPYRPVSSFKGTNLADTALMEWNALHTILTLGVWQALPIVIPLLSIKDLAVATFHQSGAC